MDSYKRNRLIGLIIIGVVAVAAAVYFVLVMTSDNSRNVEPIDIEIPFNIELSGPFDYSTYNLPVGYSKYQEALSDISLFAEVDASLTRLPKKIENIVFSQNGKKAVVFETDVISFYDVETNTLTEIPALVGGWGSGVFKNSKFLKIGYDEPTKQDALKKIDLESLKVEDLIYFIRDIDEYQLTASENKFFMVDKTNQPNILYLIDEDSRTNIHEFDYIKIASANDDYLAFQSGDNQFQSTLKIYDTQTKDSYDLPFKIMPGNIQIKGNYAYFISDSEEGDNIITVEELLSSQARPQTIIFYKWDLISQTYNQVDLELPAMPDRIEVQNDVVRMLVGEEYWDVEIGS